tara:strand:- start:9579 stop:10466 length:888 start_codon:yes stop_codon:yes gene_type:complete
MRIRRPITKKTRIGLGIASIIILTCCYSWLSWRQHEKNPADTSIPNASQLLEGFVKACTVNTPTDGNPEGKTWLWAYKDQKNFETGMMEEKFTPSWLYADVKATYGRFFKGVMLSIVLALLVGLTAGSFTRVDAFIRPPTAIQAFIPPTAALAIFFVLVGTGELLYTSIIVFGVFPALTQSIYYAATKDVSEHEIDKYYTLGASHTEVVYELIFLKILPRIFGAIRLVIGPVMVYLIATEWLVGDVGFGYTLKIQSRRLNMATVYFYLALLGCSGFLFDYTILSLRRKLCPWFGD